MAVAEAVSFPAEELVAGRLRLTGGDALGPNPWTEPRPTAADHGLAQADLDAEQLARSQHRAARELRQHPYRVFSAFLVPVLAVVAAYVYIVRGFDPNVLPAFEWVVYLGASLILAALAARAHSAQHAEARLQQEDLLSAGDRRMAFRAAERNWLNAQRLRTTTEFWLNDIPRLAAERELPAGAVFAQEVAKLFVAWTWSVKLNQRAHDYGVDIFARGNEGSAVILCEHGRAAGPEPSRVRDLAGSRHAFAADYGLLISIHPTIVTAQTEFFSDKGQLEFWHLGHVLEQCLVLYRQRTGEDAPADESRLAFLNPDGTPIVPASQERAVAAE